MPKKYPPQILLHNYCVFLEMAYKSSYNAPNLILPLPAPKCIKFSQIHLRLNLPLVTLQKNVKNGVLVEVRGFQENVYPVSVNLARKAEFGGLGLMPGVCRGSSFWQRHNRLVGNVAAPASQRKRSYKLSKLCLCVLGALS